MYTSKKPYMYGTGRRKSSVARVRLFPGGTGEIKINNRTIDNYFGLETLKMVCRQPFEVTGTEGKFDVECTVSGGGNRGGNGAAVQGGIVVLHLHAIGHQAYGYVLHAGQLFHGLFHMGYAGAAGHSGYVKFLLHNSSPDFSENQINRI